MISAIFVGNSRETKSEPLFQYDYGQTLLITGLVKQNPEVHFSLTETAGVAEPVQSTTVDSVTSVKIPDWCLVAAKTSNYSIFAFVYDKDGETSANTVRKIQIPVYARPKPDYDLPIDPSSRQQVVEELRQAIKGKGDTLTFNAGTLSLLSDLTVLSSVGLFASDADVASYLGI